VPGANGQGRTKEEARESLAEAIALILEDRRADGLRGVKRNSLLRHPRLHGCVLKREGRAHSLWTNPASGAVEDWRRTTNMRRRSSVPGSSADAESVGSMALDERTAGLRRKRRSH
jgi:hypothetical protein